MVAKLSWQSCTDKDHFLIQSPLFKEAKTQILGLLNPHDEYFLKGKKEGYY